MHTYISGLPEWLSGKESAWNSRDVSSIPELPEIPWRRKWQLTAVFLPGKFHGQRSLAGYSPRGGKRVRHDLVTKQQHTQTQIYIYLFIYACPLFPLGNYNYFFYVG